MKTQQKANTNVDPIPLDTWRRLFDLAVKVRGMEPWAWMEETAIFGVEDTVGGETLFVSVMGFIGEYHAVAVYPGARQLGEFWSMQDAFSRESITNTLSGMEYAHVVFGKKSDLNPEEKKLVETLGLKFRGGTGWPHFRSFKPGWFPWMVDAQEARWLTLAMEQLLEVAPRIQKDRRLLGTGGKDHRYLVRTPGPDGGHIAWKDVHRACPIPIITTRVTVPNATLDAVRKMQTSDNTVEVDVMPSFAAVGERGERPRSPFMMLAVDSQSGFVLGVELLSVEGSLAEMQVRVPTQLLEMLQRNHLRPSCLAIRTPWVFMVMDEVCKDLGIDIKPDPELLALTEVRSELERFNRR
jgi:hypothetical protein